TERVHRGPACSAQTVDGADDRALGRKELDASRVERASVSLAKTPLARTEPWLRQDVVVAVRGNKIQRGRRQRRTALRGQGKDMRRLQAIRENPAAELAIVKTGPRLKEEGIGLRCNEWQHCRKDVPEAHRFPRPNRIQHYTSANLSLASAADGIQGEPALVAALVAEQPDVVRVIGRARPISPPEKRRRSVGRDQVGAPVPMRQRRQLLPVPTRLDREVGPPPEKLQDGIGAPADETGNAGGKPTRGPPSQKGGQHDFEFERKKVAPLGIRDGAAAQRPPERTGIGVARGGKEEGVARGAQIPLEQVETLRSRLGPNEEAARTKGEKPLISREEPAGEGEEKSH